MNEIGKILIVFGAVLLAIGAIVVLLGKIPGLGRLPGDLALQTENFSCLFPIATSILLSILLTLVLNFVLRILNK